MDRKKKAQAAWAVLLALIGLLFIPSLPGRNTGGSESPTSDPSGEESGQENQQGSEDGAEQGSEDGSENTTGEGTGDGWLPPDEDDQAGRDGDPLREPTWGDDGTQDQEDTTGDDGSQGTGEDDDTTYGNDGQGTQDLPGNPLDGYPGHYDGGEDGQFSDIPGFDESILDGETTEPNWLGKMARGPIEWAFDNPEAAVLIVGAPVGAYLITASGVTAVGTATVSRLAAAGVTRRQAENAEAKVREFYGAGEDSTTGGTGDTTEPSGGQDTIEGSRGTGQDGAVEEPDDTWSEDDQETVEEDEEAGTVPSGTDNPFNDDYDDGDDGSDSSSDPWDDDGAGETIEEDEDAGTVPSGTDNPFNDYDDSDDGSTEEPADAVDDDPADIWMPGMGGHTPGVI